MTLNPRIRIASAAHDMGVFNFLQDMREYILQELESPTEKITLAESSDDFLKKALSLFNPPLPQNRIPPPEETLG